MIDTERIDYLSKAIFSLLHFRTFGVGKPKRTRARGICLADRFIGLISSTYWLAI
jgi:hypothetical protein